MMSSVDERTREKETLPAKNSAITMEKINWFYRNSPLTPDEKIAIEKTLSKRKDVREFIHHYTTFMHIKENFNLMPGLKPKELEVVQQSIPYVREFKALRQKQAPSVEDYKNLVTTEKRLAPLQRVIDWWTHNLDALSKEKTWEDAAGAIRNKNAAKHDEAHVIEELSQLDDLRSEWESHKFFAGYSSAKLLEFYNDFIFRMDNMFAEMLSVQNAASLPGPLTDYLHDAYSQLKELKRSAVYSMAVRLQYSEQQKDLKYDDVLTSTKNRLYKLCNIEASSNQYRSKPRRSLSPNLISEFTHRINEYAAVNRMDTTFQSMLQSLNMRKPFAKDFTDYKTLRDAKLTKDLINNPILNFSAHTLPALLEQASHYNTLSLSIFDLNTLKEKSFILNKMRLLIKSTTREYAKILNGKLSSLDKGILKQKFSDQLFYYNQKLNEINRCFGQEILGQIDSIFSQAFPQDGLNKKMSKVEYTRLTRLIDCIMTLSDFYHINNATEHSDLYANINELEHKLCLQHKLNTILNQHSSILSSTTNPSEDLILFIMAEMRRIEVKRMLTDENVNQYLNFLDQHVLTKVTGLVENNSASLNFNVLSSLGNMMLDLASDSNLKLLLLKSKSADEDNQYWNMLIHHIGEKDILPYIEQAEKNPDFSGNHSEKFQNLHMFAKHLSHVRRQIKHLIKESLLIEAGIKKPDSKSSKITSVLKSKKIKDTQLINLWMTCANKIKEAKNNPETKARYLQFLTNFLLKVSTEILLRSKENNPQLIAKLIKCFRELPEMEASIAQLAPTTSTPEPEAIPSPYSVTTPVAGNNNMLDPLYGFINKALAQDIIFKVEKFILGIIPKDKLEVLKAVCSDTNRSLFTLDTEYAKNLLNVRKDKDVLKILAILQLYKDLQTTAGSGCDPKFLIESINDAELFSNQYKELVKSNHFTSLISEVKTLAQKYFIDNEQWNFVEPEPKTRFGFF